MMTSSACLITSHRRSHSQSGIVIAEMNAIPIECHTVGLILLKTTETPTLRKMLHSLVLPTQKQFQTVEGTWFPANGTTCLASVNYNCFCTKNRMFFRERKLQIESIHEENDRLILLELFIVVRACLWGTLQIEGGLGRKNKKE